MGLSDKKDEWLRDLRRARAGFCSDKKIQEEVARIKAAADHGQTDMALAMISRAKPKAFEYPASDSNYPGWFSDRYRLGPYKLGKEAISFADQYDTLLHHFLREDYSELAQAAIERMTRPQLMRQRKDGRRAINIAPANESLMILDKLEPEDLTLSDDYDGVPLKRWIAGSHEGVNAFIDKTPSSVFGGLLDRLIHRGEISETGRSALKNHGPDIITKLLQKADPQTFAELPDFYKAFKSESEKDPNCIPIVKAIEEKMAGTLAPYVSQTAVMIHRPRNSGVALPAFNPEEAIDAALESGRASDAMQIGRDILDDCTTLLERFRQKNLESLAAAAQASKLLRDVVAETKEHAQLAEDVGSGRKSLNPPGMIVRQLARVFPSLDPISALEGGLTGAGDDVRRSLAASQSLLRAYEDIQELHGPIEERLDQLQDALQRAVSVTNERINAAPEDSKERKDAMMLRDIFEATARTARVSGAMVSVNAQTADQNARVEGKFVVAVMEIQSALNIALTNASLALAQIKEGAIPVLRHEAALTVQDQSRQIAARMEAFEGVVLERERTITTEIPTVLTPELKVI